MLLFVPSGKNETMVFVSIVGCALLIQQNNHLTIDCLQQETKYLFQLFLFTYHK